jgi:uncharacterized Zn-binding protein involved in type VI secretion
MEDILNRYNIVHGDKTTSGGHAIASSNSCSNMGKAIVMLGDRVFFPNCKTTGVIVGQGPRRPSDFMGRKFALSDDICMCACGIKPRLINSLSNMMESFDAEEIIKSGYGDWLGRSAEPEKQPVCRMSENDFYLRIATRARHSLRENLSLLSTDVCRKA